MDMIPISEAAEHWEVSDRTARNYCKKYSAIIKAEKRNGQWMIPKNALPPAKLYDAKHFVQNYLKYKNNTTENFDWSACGSSSDGAELFLQLLELAQIIERRDKQQSYGIDNIIILSRGWDLAFGKMPGNNMFIANICTGDINLISMNIGLVNL